MADSLNAATKYVATHRPESLEWGPFGAKRAPMSNNEVIEVRQIHEMPDFPEDVQKAAEGFEHRNA